MEQGYFEKIYLKYFHVLQAYALRIVAKNEVAEDIVQEVFLECWDRRSSLDLSTSLKPYLYTLTHRKSIDFIRKSENKVVMFTDVGLGVDQLFMEALLIENEMDLKEVERVIHNTVEQLPDKCKQVFLMSRKAGLKNREISEKLALSVKTVEKHITRSLKEIRENLVARDLI